MENIHVSLRVRPLIQSEIQKGEENCWKLVHSTFTLQEKYQNLITQNKKNFQTPRTTFNFDRVFDSEIQNYQIYQQTVKEIAQSALSGINGTVFVYGQTGTGKTYTMMGTQYKYLTEKVLQNPVQYQQQQYRSNSQTFRRQIINQEEIHTGKNCNSEGILVYALREIFESIEADLDKTYFLKCQYIEIYNDQVFDLLSVQEELGEILTVNEDNNRDFYVKGVNEVSVSTLEDILNVIQKGEINKHYASTSMNHMSSRSHSIFRLSVQTLSNNFIRSYRREQKQSCNVNNQQFIYSDIININQPPLGTIVTESQLNFVDLAGSEKISANQILMDDYGALMLSGGSERFEREYIKMKERAKEGQHINKSLFFLTQVISLRAEEKGTGNYIPYRNSPLTKILRSSLGGNSRTLIILCVTPAASQIEQTLSTFRFGVSAKKIQNKIEANIKKSNDDEALRLLVIDYEKKLKDQEKARQQDKIYQQQLEQKIQELSNSPFNLQQDQQQYEINYQQGQIDKYLKELIDVKGQLELQKNKVKLLQGNFDEVYQRHIELYTKFINQNSFNFKNQQITYQLLQSFASQVSTIKKLTKKLALYEKEDMIQLLSEGELNCFEQKVNKINEGIKFERFRRYYQEEINVLKQKLEEYTDVSQTSDQQCNQQFEQEFKNLDQFMNVLCQIAVDLESQLKQLCIPCENDIETIYCCDDNILQNIVEKEQKYILDLFYQDIHTNTISNSEQHTTTNRQTIQRTPAHKSSNNKSKNQIYETQEAKTPENKSSVSLESQKQISNQVQSSQQKIQNIQKNVDIFVKQFIVEDLNLVQTNNNFQERPKSTTPKLKQPQKYIEECIIQTNREQYGTSKKSERQEVFINLAEINGRRNKSKNICKSKNNIENEQIRCPQKKITNLGRQNSNSGRALLISEALYLKAKRKLEEKNWVTPTKKITSEQFYGNCCTDFDDELKHVSFLDSHIQCKDCTVLTDSMLSNKPTIILTNNKDSACDNTDIEHYIKVLDENVKPKQKL